MSNATLVIKDRGADGVDYVVSCEHGRTTSTLTGPARADLLGKATALQMHQGWGPCRCTRKLRKEYPASLIELEASRLYLLYGDGDDDDHRD